MGNEKNMLGYLRTATFVGLCALSLSLYITSSVQAVESVTAKENLEKLVKTKSCRGCDLAGLVMNRMDLSGVDLEGADLSSSKLSLTNLAGANLKKTNLRGTVFGGTDLSNADLRGADMRGASIDTAYHEGALFDGALIQTKTSEVSGEPAIEKKILAPDPEKPKKSPENREVKVGERRDFEEPPPVLTMQSDVQKAQTPGSSTNKANETATPADIQVAKAPQAKKIAPVQEAIVEGSEKKNVTPETKVNSQSQQPVLPTPSATEKSKEVTTEPPKNQPVPPHIATNGKETEQIQADRKSKVKNNAEPSMTLSPEDPGIKKVTPIQQAIVDNDKNNTPVTAAPGKQNEARKLPGEKQPQDSTTLKGQKDKPDIGKRDDGGASDASQNLAADKGKKDNLSRLLDKNKCYGCDLSGINLSGKDLAGADLEKADLRGANLEKTDLAKANFKGTQLMGANLRQASLKDADFYKADLTGADLSGADVKGALFDNAKISSVIGFSGASK